MAIFMGMEFGLNLWPETYEDPYGNSNEAIRIGDHVEFIHALEDANGGTLGLTPCPSS